MSHLAPPPVHPSRRGISPSSLSPSRPSSPRPLPPALPPRYDDSTQSTPQLPPSMPGSVEDLGVTFDSDDVVDVLPMPEDTRDEEELSEVELREMYDNEEIDRFLHIFQTYVSEIKAVDQGDTSSVREKGVDGESRSQPEEVLGSMIASQIGPSTSSTTHSSLSEWCAQYLVARLPDEQQHIPDLTMKQVHATVERAYLALLPGYLMLFGRVLRLATWQDYNTSLILCILYWVLWAHGLLLPALCIRLLYSLARRRFLPYPTLDELRERRIEVDRAEQFGVALSKRLAMSSSFGVKDAWYLLQGYRKYRKQAKTDGVVSPEPPTVTVENEEVPLEDGDDFASTLSAEELTLAQVALYSLGQLADLHERVRNLFLWRRPQVSSTCAIILIGCAVVTAMPAVYLSRMCGLGFGIAFWHVVPVIAAMPPSDRMRVPPALWQVPTDAQYAMELISQRVARGLEVRPRQRKHSPFSSDSNIAQSQSQSRSGHSPSYSWEKVGERASSAKDYVDNVKETFKGDNWKNLNYWRSINPLSPSIVALPHRGLQPRVDTRSYPAQHGKTTGLITLSPSELIFTSLASLTPKLVIKLKDIASVQKQGILNGLRVLRRQIDENGVTEDVEEKFSWVGGRDDLFTHLVGSQGIRWINVR